MPFPYDKYPWLNFQELNLAYFIKHFREIFKQWDELYRDLTEWKETTDQDLADWKSATEAGLESWKTGLTTSLEAWKSQTATDISGWETATLAALDAWKTATTAVFEEIRVQAAGSASAAAASASQADTARAAAASAQSAAEQAAAGISAELAQIRTNTADIADLKSAIEIHRLFTIPDITAFEKGGWSNGVKSNFRQENRARTIDKFYALDTINICLKNRGTPLIYIEKYDTVGNRTEVITWATQVTINKGDIVTITLSMGNNGTAAETVLEDIYNAFSFLSLTPVVVTDTDKLTFGQGIISTANAIATYSTNRIYAKEYIPTSEKLIYFSILTGYRAYIVTYNDNYEIVDYGVGGWLTGNTWKDLSGAKYYRLMISKTNDAEILPSDASAVTIKTYPTVHSKTIISISKDGINNSEKTYAPLYPKSSIVSFEKAIMQGFDGIELHVQITSDGIPVVLHEQNINGVARNPDGSEIAQTVSITSTTLEQLNQYDFGILYGEKYAGTKILTLEQALEFCKDKGMFAFIEPVVTLSEEYETVVCNLLKKYGMQNQCGYFAYDGPVLIRVKNKIPTATLYLWRNDNAQMASGISYSAANLKTDKNRFFYYTYAETEIADETIQQMASANIELMLQHMNGEEPSNIETVGNIYSSARVTQIVPASGVLGSI